MEDPDLGAGSLSALFPFWETFREKHASICLKRAFFLLPSPGFSCPRTHGRIQEKKPHRFYLSSRKQTRRLLYSGGVAHPPSTLGIYSVYTVPRYLYLDTSRKVTPQSKCSLGSVEAITRPPPPSRCGTSERYPSVGLPLGIKQTR